MNIKRGDCIRIKLDAMIPNSNRLSKFDRRQIYRVWCVTTYGLIILNNDHQWGLFEEWVVKEDEP